MVNKIKRTERPARERLFEEAFAGLRSSAMIRAQIPYAAKYTGSVNTEWSRESYAFR